MLLVNLPEIKDQEYQILGIVSAEVVYSKHLGKDFMASFKNMLGGELKSYTEMIADAKEHVKRKIIEEAESMYGDAILNVGYDITNLQNGSALVVSVTGTAIKYI